ncbi:MAG: hypothetical protein ACPGVB_13860, partial [Chitinophagales bacterium]
MQTIINPNTITNLNTQTHQNTMSKLTRIAGLYMLALFIVSSCTPPKRIIVEPTYNDDETVTMPAGAHYKAGKGKRTFFGEHYRDAWTTPVKVPIIKLSEVEGGLKPLKKGGGMQTLSLRLENEEGNQFVLRTIDKDPSSVVPDEFKETFAVDLIQDQISAGHPFGAFAIPRMAEAVGVYHTNPKYVFVGDDPNLEEFQKTFANRLYLFEERPNDDETDRPFFGSAEDIEGTPDVIEKIQEDHDHVVDEHLTARSRLFDTFINDWDRHDDQWRWAQIDTGKGKVYQPIPRDRDQAFYKFDGVLPSMTNRKWGMRKFQKFDHEVRDIAGIAFNGRYFDRNFTTRLNKKDWLDIAEEMQTQLTDEIIEAAIRDMPEELFDIDGKDIIAKLQSRRKLLVNTAERLYDHLSKIVTVVGSDDKEDFQIDFVNDKDVEVTVYRLSKKKENRQSIFYQRTFHANETQEIRLFGLGKDDQFTIKGSGKRNILVRAIGGKGNDVFTDETTGSGKKVKIYDTKEGNKLDLVSGAVNKTSKDTMANYYDRKEFKNNVVTPALFFGFNPDDGLLLGGGVTIVTHGFRKYPYAAKHTIVGNASLAAEAFNFKYNGDFTDAVGKWNLNLDLDARIPNATYNFFGLGNETPEFGLDNSLFVERDNDFNRVRLQQVNFHPSIRQTWNDERQSISFGPHYQWTDVERTEGRFVDLVGSGLTAKDFAASQYVGAKLKYQYARVNHPQMRLQGVVFNLDASWNNRIDKNQDKDFIRLGGELNGYIPLSRKAIFAVRVGGAHNFGDFEFFQANTIGNVQNFRGVRRFRYAGQTNFYQNTDLRIKLFDIKNYILPTTVGVILFNDFGRVYVDNDTSDVMHHAYGGGIFFAPFGMAVFRATYGVS